MLSKCCTQYVSRFGKLSNGHRTRNGQFSPQDTFTTKHHFLGFESYDQPAAAAAKSLQSCLTLCDPRDGSPPGFPVPGILQARTQE